MDDILAAVEARAARTDWHENAFRCSACPKDGCPFWWRLEWESSGEDGVLRARSHEGCGAALSQGLFMKVLVGQAIERAANDARTNEIVEAQREQKEGLRATLRGILHIAAQVSPNPVAREVLPLLPRVLSAARRLLPKKRGA